MEEETIQAQESINCTETVIIPEGRAMRVSRISGLQVMGVFTLCGLLTALDWGGVTGSLIIGSRSCDVKEVQQQHGCIYQHK
jgi:hypothetical protein